MKPEIINSNGKTYRAVRCPRCPGHALIYPAKALALHMAMHAVKDQMAKPNLVQQAFARAERSKWT